MNHGRGNMQEKGIFLVHSPAIYLLDYTTPQLEVLASLPDLQGSYFDRLFFISPLNGEMNCDSEPK